MQKADGMNYAPVSQGVRHVVCSGDTFPIGVIGLDHGHIYAMCNGLLEAGAKLVSVYDPDPEKVKAFQKQYPQVNVAVSEKEILENKEIRLIASAIRPDLRCSLGIRVMEHGKDYFADKPGMLSMEEIDAARKTCKRTGMKYMRYFGERVHVEGAVFAQQLIEQGEIGQVLQMTILAPHRLNKKTRPDWFFQKDKMGGIITDIGSHQIEQFLTYTGQEDAEVLYSAVANYANPDYPEFEDFGAGMLKAANGATCYFRLDWFTPDGLGAWGDGRVFLIGTKGTIEIRKYLNVGESSDGDNVYLVNSTGEHKFQVTGKVGFIFFGDFILDCINRTECVMTQEHVFRAMELAITAQNMAVKMS